MLNIKKTLFNILIQKKILYFLSTKISNKIALKLYSTKILF